MTTMKNNKSYYGGGNDDRGLDGIDESLSSFGTGPMFATAKPTVKYAWTNNDKVNIESFHRMQDEYRDAKKREQDLMLKTKQLAAQLARTEEAAKRALVQTDASAKGGAAQKLLDSERAIQKLRTENAELTSKLAREKKRANDFKAMADAAKSRLDAVLKEQRAMVRKMGELEGKQAQTRRRGPEDDLWSEEAGRRFVQQQEELVNLREENERLRKLMEEEGPAAQTAQVEAQINELQNLVRFYEKKIQADAGMVGGDGGAGGALAGVPSADDWVLEEFFHNDEMFLLDRKTGKVFTVPGDNNFPRPVGLRTAKEVRVGSANKMDRFLAVLDDYLLHNQSRLQDMFREFDLDNSGVLDRRETQRMLAKLMPDLDPREVEELRTMLDMDGNGEITFQELLESIKEAFAARTAAKVGKHIEVNDALDRLRDAFREHKKLAREAFDELDADHDGCLAHLEVVRLAKRFVADMHQREVRFLLAKLQQWDVAGESKISFDEVYQALELVKLHRVGQGMAGAMRSSSPMKHTPGRAGAASARDVSPGRTSLHASRAGPLGGGGGGLKETYLRERVAQLEAELRETVKRQAGLEEDSKRAETLARDVSAYRARIEDLEKEFMKIDLLGHMEAANGDEQLQKAWEVASTFKKRFLEHKAELDNIKLTYARMQAQLEETHNLLHDEHRKRFKLEDEINRLGVELLKAKDLERVLQHERQERVKLESEYLALQSRALGAPGEAVAELRGLREELFALRREKAMAQQKENEVRRELHMVRQELDGMSQDGYKAMQRENTDMKKRLASVVLELQAAQDKLEVYRRTELPGGADLLMGDEDRSLYASDKRPDADKSPEELRRELMQLRDVWRLDQAEIKKLHKVLETESGQTLEAKAAVEEAHKEVDRIRRNLQEDMRKLERELERKDERIRKLELQLRGAYAGIGRAVRSSRGGGSLRDSLRSESDFSDVAETQNVFELHVAEANIYEEALGKDPSVFFTWDFFMHETQATPVLSSNAPNFNTLIQYVVDNDPFVLEYMDTHILEMELCRARGYDYDVLGVARVPLRQIIEDIEVGAAIGAHRPYHYADIFGADGKRIGRVRYGYSFRRPLENMLRDYRNAVRAKRISEPDERDPWTKAVAQAAAAPASAKYIAVYIDRCEGLPADGLGQSRPYVHYRFPGHRTYRDTITLSGTSPAFKDEAVWALSKTPELEADLRTRAITFVVFDESTTNSQRSILGVASVPLAPLVQGLPAEGAFKLLNPLTRKAAGKLLLRIEWTNPLALPGEVKSTAPQAQAPIRSDVVHDNDMLLPVKSGVASGMGAGAGKPVDSLASFLAADGGAAAPRFPNALGAAPPRPPRTGGLAGELMDAQQDYGLQAESQSLRNQQQMQMQQQLAPAGQYGLQRGPSFGRQPPQLQQQQYGRNDLNPIHDQGYAQPPPPMYNAPASQQQYGLGAEAAPRRPSSGYAPSSQYAQPLGGPQAQQLQQQGAGQYGLTAALSQQQQQATQQRAPLGAERLSDYGMGAELRPTQMLTDPRGVGAGGMLAPAAAPIPTATGGALQTSASLYTQMQQQQPPGGYARAPSPAMAAPVESGAGGGGGGFGLFNEPEMAGGVKGKPSGTPIGHSTQHPTGRYDPYAPLAPQAGAAAGLSPLPAASPGEYGLDAEAATGPSPPQGGMLMGGRPAPARPRYQEVEQSMESPLSGAAAAGLGLGLASQPPPPPPPSVSTAAAAAGPVLMRESPDHAHWSGQDHKVFLCIHSLELMASVMRGSSGSVPYVTMTHTFLQEGFNLFDTYTHCMHKRVGTPLPVDYCVSYNLLADAARKEIATYGGENLEVELQLMGTALERLDGKSLSTGSVEKLGTAKLHMGGMWAGKQGDAVNVTLDIMSEEDDLVKVGKVTLSLVACAALNTARNMMGRR